MKRMMMFAVVALVAGCSSTPKDEGAKVEERTPQVAQPPSTAPTPPPDKTAGVQPPSVSGDPLKDPNNIPSRRSIYFDYDSNAVKEEFKPLVSAHAGYI